MEFTTWKRVPARDVYVGDRISYDINGGADTFGEVTRVSRDAVRVHIERFTPHDPEPSYAYMVPETFLWREVTVTNLSHPISEQGIPDITPLSF